MQVPKLTDDELAAFLDEGAKIAKLATHNPDGTIRMTPLWYENDDGVIRFNTFRNSEAVGNLQHDQRASLLIDSTDFPYKGVHYTGEAEVDTQASEPEQIAEMFARYSGGYDPALEYAGSLVQMGTRVFVRFHPRQHVTWDFGKAG